MLMGPDNIKKTTRRMFKNLFPAKRVGVEHYDLIISPEVLNDDFYEVLKGLAARSDLKTLLEIGSSSGEGSTKAIIEGVLSRSNYENVQLHCLEISKIRFEKLSKKYTGLNFVNIHRLSSVGPESFPTTREIKDFYRKTPSALNIYPLTEILSWLKKDVEYLRINLAELSKEFLGGGGSYGIDFIQSHFVKDPFDFVLIDGGEFQGYAEFKMLKGAKFICLDDINSYKCRFAYDELVEDPSYKLYAENWNLRNGWAVFEKVA